MFTRAFVRSELSDLLGGRLGASATPLEGDEILAMLRHQGLALAIWSDELLDNRQALPRMIVTQSGEARNVLAWTATYSPAIRPFTAYCRVLDDNDFVNYYHSARKPKLSRVELAIVGAVVGELLSTEAAWDRLIRGHLTASSLQSSLIFVLMREFALYGAAKESKVASAWGRVRAITQQPGRSLQSVEVEKIASILRALSEQKESSTKSPFYGWSESIIYGRPLRDTPILGLADELTSGTREDRVVIYDRIAKALASSNIPADQGSFLLGYLASSILPGTTRYANLIKPFSDRFPSALIWLGICAGLHPEAQVMQEFGGIGRRVLRDIVAPEELTGPPRSDISVAELEIFLGGDRRIEDFIRTVPSYLTVELIPCVQASVNWPPRKPGQDAVLSPASAPSELPPSRAYGEERAAMLRRLESARAQIDEVVQSLSGAAESKRQQSELFPERSGKRGKNR